MPPEPALPPPTAPRRRRLPLAALGLAAALAVFGWGIVHLFELRFAGGDVYPPYSTLRRDPLGAAVFYDALAALPGLSVERNLRPLASLAQTPKLLLSQLSTPDPAVPATPSLPTSAPLVCFYLGADAYEWPYLFRHNEFERLDAVIRQGGRVVLTFLPAQTPLTEKRLDKLRHDQTAEPANSPPDQPFHPKGTPAPPAKIPRQPGVNPAPTPSSSPSQASRKRQVPAGLRAEDLVESWGIDFRRGDNARPKSTPAKLPDDQGGPAQPVTGGPLDGTGKVAWHSVLAFDLDTPAARVAGWRALYQRGGHPVVVARRIGDRGGELILASDSYFLSNEALRADARPALLAGLIGPARRVIFDETHLGIAEQPGMMTLARRYHLQGGLAALALLAALFIWRNVLSLVPPPIPLAGSAASATAVTGRDASAGFLNLLRRGVSPRELIAVCLAQWQRAPGPRPPDPAAVERLRALAAAEAAQSVGRRSPATAYRAMCAALGRPR